MFMFTVTKPGLRQAGALALCAVCLSGTIAAAVHFSGQGAAAVQTSAAAAGVETTQDIAAYFTGYGFEVDLSTAAVDKVKIPRRWDDSFTAFNQVVGESGLSLENYKGKTVEKWTVLCPARSDGEKDTYCVLLVYKARPIGAYLLAKPGGEVTGLVTAAQSAAAEAEQAGEGAETAAPGTVPEPGAETAAPSDEADAGTAAETAAELYDDGAFPTE